MVIKKGEYSPFINKKKNGVIKFMNLYNQDSKVIELITNIINDNKNNVEYIKANKKRIFCNYSRDK